MSEQWWWCLTHGKVEPADAGPLHDRLGPYPTPEAAARWQERHEDRAETWKAQEEAEKDEWDREDDEWEGL